jgi:acyl-CoA oxidase
MFLGLAHAAMTAEGDNSVLMQKVAKERLATFKGPKHSGPAPTPDLMDGTSLHKVLERHEDLLFSQLGVSMKRAGKDGLFTEWMYEQSNTIQASGRVYGERLISEQFLQVISTADHSLQPVLRLLHRLYVLDILERDLGAYMLTGILTSDIAKAVGGAIEKTCKELAPDCLALVDSFAMTNEMLSAPIAQNWITYNDNDNKGEVRKK